MDRMLFLKELLNSPSPSGFEDSASELWEEYLLNHINGIEIITGEPYGSSIAKYHRSSEGKNIMLCAHIDEIGFMIKYINDNGYLYLTPVGGVDVNVLPGQRLRIHTAEHNSIVGIIGRPPIHVLEEDEAQSFEISDLFVDIGAINKADAMRVVSVGDFATFDTNFSSLYNRSITGHGLDNRIGVYCMAEILREFAIKEAKNNIFAVASVGEEISSIGAKNSMYLENMDYAIVIDLTFATDYPGMNKEK